MGCTRGDARYGMRVLAVIILNVQIAFQITFNNLKQNVTNYTK